MDMTICEHSSQMWLWTTGSLYLSVLVPSMPKYAVLSCHQSIYGADWFGLRGCRDDIFGPYLGIFGRSYVGNSLNQGDMSMTSELLCFKNIATGTNTQDLLSNSGSIMYISVQEYRLCVLGKYLLFLLPLTHFPCSFLHLSLSTCQLKYKINTLYLSVIRL